MLIVRDLFRFSGAFFMRRRFESDGLYRAIFTEYVKNLICDGLTVEFFTEGTRSRAGKLLQPRMGMLSIVTEPFFERRIKDLILCPINISYEKVIEGTTYGLELLGRPKQKESLESLLRASLQKLLWSNFGRLSVSFAQPISLREYTESLTVEESSRSNRAVEFEPYKNLEDRRLLVQSLAYRVAFELNKQATIMPTNMVAAILLTFRSGVPHQQLIDRVVWLKEEIILRGGRVEWELEWDHTNGEAADTVVSHAVDLLSDIIRQRRPGIYEPDIDLRAGDGLKNLLVLGLYRNQITHLFFPEGVVCCALHSFEDFSSGMSLQSQQNQGVLHDQLIDRIKDLSELLSLEFIHKQSQDSCEDWDSVLDQMKKRGIIVIDPQTGRISASSTVGGQINPSFFLCNMFFPFVESYYVAALALYSLFPVAKQNESVLLQRMLWLAETLFFENKVTFFESCSSDTLKNAIQLFIKAKVIVRAPNGDIQLSALYQSDKSHVVGLIDRIRRFRSDPQASSAGVLLDRGLLSKL